MMERFLIRTNETKDSGLEITKRISDFLTSHGKTVSVELMDEARIKGEEHAASFDPGMEPDLVIVLGGDGTMLRAARDFMYVSVPLLGVNLGSLGYLTEVEKTNVIPALEKIINDDYVIEERMMLEGTFLRQGEEAGHIRALNDICVSKTVPYQAIGLNIYVNGQFLKDYRTDGVIVSTPTGSTGYNLSAGGPIVEPGADILIMTPVSPHTLMARSIVLSAKDEIRIELKGARDGSFLQAVASADSASHFELETGDSIVLRRSDKRTKIVKLSSVSFLEVLSRKLK